MSAHEEHLHNKHPSLGAIIKPFFVNNLPEETSVQEGKKLYRKAMQLFVNSPPDDQKIADKAIRMFLEHEEEYDIDATDILYLMTRYHIFNTIVFDDGITPRSGLTVEDQKALDDLFDAYPGLSHKLVDIEKIDIKVQETLYTEGDYSEDEDYDDEDYDDDEDYEESDDDYEEDEDITIDMSVYPRKHQDLYQVNIAATLENTLDSIESNIGHEYYDPEIFRDMIDYIDVVGKARSTVIQESFDQLLDRACDLLPQGYDGNENDQEEAESEEKDEYDDFNTFINDISPQMERYLNPDYATASYSKKDDEDNPEYEAILDMYYRVDPYPHNYSMECLDKYLRFTHPTLITPKALCYFMFEAHIDDVFFGKDYSIKEADIEKKKKPDIQPTQEMKDEHDLSFVSYQPAEDVLANANLPVEKHVATPKETPPDEEIKSSVLNEDDIAHLHELNDKYNFLDMHITLGEIENYYASQYVPDDFGDLQKVDTSDAPEFDAEAMEILRLKRFVIVSADKTAHFDKKPAYDTLDQWLRSLSDLGISTNRTLKQEIEELQDNLIDIISVTPKTSKPANKNSKYPFKNRKNGPHF